MTAFVVGELWLRPLASSLWGDEMGTWWVIDGTLQQTVARAWRIEGQSPAYYVFLRGWVHLFGGSEIALRAPSLLASAGAAFLLFRLASKMLDGEVARLAVIGICVWPSVAFAASDARPYACGLLLVVASAYSLVAWLDDGRARAGIVMVIVSAAMAYFHPLTALMLIPMGLYAWATVASRRTRVGRRSLLAAAVAIIVLDLPVVVEAVGLASRRSEWSPPSSASVADYLSFLLPPAFAVVAVGVFLAWPMIGSVISPRWMSEASRRLLVSWYLAPALVFILFTLAAGVRLAESRYFVFIAPAAAILAAFALRCIEPARVRRWAALGLSIVSVLLYAAPNKAGDIRIISSIERETADPSTVVLVPSAFTESMRQDWYQDRQMLGFLGAASDYYPLTGQVVTLPRDMTEGDASFVASRVDDALVGMPVVEAISGTGSRFEVWLDARLAERGYRRIELASVEGITLLRYEPRA